MLKRMLMVAGLVAPIGARAFGAGQPDAAPAYGLDWFTVRCEADGFLLRVPPAWVRIPGMHVEALQAGATARRIGQSAGSSLEYRFGFQESPVAEWFHGPYFLVDTHLRRRPSLQELAALPRLSIAAPGGLGFRHDGTRGVFSRTEPGGYFFEAESNIIWFNLGTELPLSKGAHAVAAMFLTQKGALQINFYAPPHATAAYLDVFEQIARSVEIRPAMRYRTASLEAWPVLSMLDWSDPAMRLTEILLVATLGIGAAGMSVALTRRIELDEANPLNPLDDELDAPTP